jgi:uncharacterized protein YecT (DUF1311 family)
MFRAVSALLSLTAVLRPVQATAQNLVQTSRLEVALGSRPCQPGQWCLFLHVSGAPPAQPIPGAFLLIPDCGTAVADSTGQIDVRCSQAGTPDLEVHAIGFWPASGLLSVELGRSYSGTATLLPAAAPRETDGFVLPPCAMPDEEGQRRCLALELQDAELRLSEAFDSARASSPSTLSLSFLDSAQTAWERFVTAQCRGEASLRPPGSGATITQLDCRLRLTERRIYQLGEWTWRPRR